MESMDLLANNIANASTSGYKSDSEFYTLFTSEAADTTHRDPSRLPMIQRQWTDFSQGLLEPTNNPLDFGISGKGFFVVNGPTGPLYTRSGSFQVSTSGQLTTIDGYPLLDDGGKPIQADPNHPIEVSLDGDVHQHNHVDRKVAVSRVQRLFCLGQAG